MERKAPKVDDIVLDPKHPCTEMSGYRMSHDEIDAIRMVVNSVMDMRDALSGVDFVATIARINNDIPIDDASLLQPGDGIVSLVLNEAAPDKNPLDDLELVAKIATLCQHMIESVEESFEKMVALSDSEREAQLKGMADRLIKRRNYFARNIDKDKYAVSHPALDGDRCQCRECLESRPTSHIDDLNRVVEKAKRGMESGSAVNRMRDAGEAPSHEEILRMLGQLDEQIRRGGGGVVN
jgi:hypothetical protein